MADGNGVKVSTEFELRIPDDVTEKYADGITGMIAGWPNSKLIFHSVRPNADGANPDVENRQAVLILSIPTGALIELSRNVLANFTTGRAQVSAASDLYKAKIESLLAEIPVLEPSPSSQPKADKDKSRKK